MALQSTLTADRLNSWATYLILFRWTALARLAMSLAIALDCPTFMTHQDQAIQPLAWTLGALWTTAATATMVTNLRGTPLTNVG